LQALVTRYGRADEYQLALGRLLTYRPETRAQGIRTLEAIRSTSNVAGAAKAAWRQALVWEGTKPSNRAALRSYLLRYQDDALQGLLARVSSTESEPTGLVRSKEEQRGFDALNAKNLPEAEKVFQAVIEASPRSFGALAGMGYVKMERQEFPAAIEFFESALAGAPESAELQSAIHEATFWNYVKAGNQATAAGKYAEAGAQFKLALEARPASTEALEGYAGTLLSSGRAAEAVPLFEKLVAADAKSTSRWKSLFFARRQAAGGKAAIETSKQLPPAIQVALSQDLDFLGSLAAAYDETGAADDAKRVMAQAKELAASQHKELPVDLKLLFAGLHLKQKQLSQAVEFYAAAAKAAPERADAWEGWMAALVQQNKEREAVDVLRQLPDAVAQSMSGRIGFLRLSAAIEGKAGRLDAAESTLRRVLELEADKPQFSTQVQLASIWLQQGRPANAERMLYRLADEYPDEPDVWKMLLIAVARSEKQEEAARIASRIPAPVIERLADDTGFVTVLASVRGAAGKNTEALEMVRGVMKRLNEAGEPVPNDLRMQHAWLLYNAAGDDNELYNTLVVLRDAKGLTEKQSNDTRDIWSMWTRRRAAEARAEGNYARSEAILTAAARLLPGDTRITAALAGTHFQAGQTARAFEIYKTWGLAGAESFDYSSAVAAAMAQKDNIAWQWAAEGLRQYPRDPELLNIAGKMAAREGNFKQAEKFWRQAIVALQTEKQVDAKREMRRDPAPALKPDTKKEEDADPSKNLGRILLGPTAVLPRPALRSVTPSWFQTASYTEMPRGYVMAAIDQEDKAGGGAAITKAEEKPTMTAQAKPRPVSPGAGRSAAAEALDSLSPNEELSRLAPTTNAQSAKQREIEDQIRAVEGRNTPYFRADTMINNRSGRSGFERRLLHETELEASVVASDKVRATLLVRPTTISLGASDGSSDLRLGLAPKGATFPSNSVAGLGAEGQISTNTLGLRFGSTPRGFLVQNFVAGLRYRPMNGPISILLSRDPIKDSKLSYAGAADPVTGQVFGGVMGDLAQIRGDFGGAKSGFYFSGGYQRITGTAVESNRRVEAGAGSYWHVAQVASGSLQAGFSVYTMGYEKNSRYYTLGHGGYFSPQRYYVAGVPVTWQARHRRVETSITGSLGIQYFREDTAKYFPLDAVLQASSKLLYPAQTSTGVNFNVEMHTIYKFSPNWGLSVTASANNTRNFNTQSVSFGIVHTFRPTAIESSTVASVPNWRGGQPLGLR